MDPEKKSFNFIFPTKYVIPKSLKFSHWPSKQHNFTKNYHHFCLSSPSRGFETPETPGNSLVSPFFQRRQFVSPNRFDDEFLGEDIGQFSSIPRYNRGMGVEALAVSKQ